MRIKLIHQIDNVWLQVGFEQYVVPRFDGTDKAIWI
jgi:hypothetical protein